MENLASCGEEWNVEDWEPVSTEKGHWATLYSNLEVLLHLCNLVGLEALQKLPSVPFDNVSDDSDMNYIVNPANLKLKFYDRGVRVYIILVLALFMLLKQYTGTVACVLLL